MAERLFDTYPFVDWSARGGPSPARPVADAIWPAESTAGAAPIVIYHRTRRSAFEHLAARLRLAFSERRRILVGCDFPYGYPAGCGACLGDAAGTLGACFAAPEGLSDAGRESCLREEGWVLGA